MNVTKEQKKAMTDLMTAADEDSPFGKFILAHLIVDGDDPEPKVVTPDSITDKDGKAVATKRMGLLYMMFHPLLCIFGLADSEKRRVSRSEQSEFDHVSWAGMFLSLPFSMAAGYFIGSLLAAWIAVKWVGFALSLVLAFVSGFIIYFIVRGLYEYISTGGKGIGTRV